MVGFYEHGYEHWNTINEGNCMTNCVNLKILNNVWIYFVERSRKEN